MIPEEVFREFVRDAVMRMIAKDNRARWRRARRHIRHTLRAYRNRHTNPQTKP